jgi:hypothetical protein
MKIPRSPRMQKIILWFVCRHSDARIWIMIRIPMIGQNFKTRFQRQYIFMTPAGSYTLKERDSIRVKYCNLKLPEFPLRFRIWSGFGIRIQAGQKDSSYITSSYKTPSYKTSIYQTSIYRMSRLQNVQVTKRPFYKRSRLQNVQDTKCPFFVNLKNLFKKTFFTKGIATPWMDRIKQDPRQLSAGPLGTDD